MFGINNTKKCLIRIATLAAAAGSASGLLYSTNTSDTSSTSEATVLGSVSTPLCPPLLLQWPISEARSSFMNLDLDYLQLGSRRLNHFTSGSVPSEDERNDVPGNGCNGSKTIANAVALVLPALVNISVPCKLDGKDLGQGTGSGTIIGTDGTILTCAHLVLSTRGKKVVSKGKVDVTLQDGQTFVGTVVKADLHSDIAIVKIKSRTPLPAAKLGSSQKLRPGDWVVAMGAPHSLQNTITAGIVSCIDRTSSEMGLGGMLRKYIQIDCAFNPGNSGGPLINIDGEIVGVNVLRRSAATGLNFAVPIDVVLKIMEHFKKNGRIVRPWLGTKMLDLNGAVISHLRNRDPMFPKVKKGVLVFMVAPGSPADVAGLRPGDVVIEFHGKPVGSISEITELMEDRIGIPSVVVVKRAKGTSKTLTVVPEEAIPEL